MNNKQSVVLKNDPEIIKHKKSFSRNFNKKNDEWVTPSCLVTLLIPYLESFARQINKKSSEITIWCPFDHEESKYVQILSQHGYKIIHSHISDGQDFFDYRPDNWDIAISNPPFSKKLAIFERLVKFEKPFLMLMNIMALNYQEIGQFFWQVGNDIQFLIPDKKVSFDGRTSSFCSGYVSYKFLDKTEFVHLDNNNSKGFFKE